MRAWDADGHPKLPPMSSLTRGSEAPSKARPYNVTTSQPRWDWGKERKEFQRRKMRHVRENESARPAHRMDDGAVVMEKDGSRCDKTTCFLITPLPYLQLSCASLAYTSTSKFCICSYKEVKSSHGHGLPNLDMSPWWLQMDITIATTCKLIEPIFGYGKQSNYTEHLAESDRQDADWNPL